MAEKSNKKYNNYVDIIKFVAALLVIFSHSYRLSNNSIDLLSRYIKGASFGSFAVAVFFSFSGYYIMKSLKTKGDKKFIYKRLIRILPELIIVVLLTIFILGPVFTNLSVTEYFLNKKTYLYLLNGIMVPYHNLPGVFINNIYGSTVNGALWTLPIEFICYIGIYLCYKLKLTKNNKFLLVSFILCLIGYSIILYLNIEFLLTIIRPILVFIFSSILVFAKNIKKVYMLPLIIISILLFILKSFICYNIFLIIFLPLVLFYVINNISIKSKIASFLGKISYSIYLVGFPMQQSVVSIFGGKMNPYVNFVISVLLAVICATVINMLYEKVIKPKLEVIL